MIKKKKNHLKILIKILSNFTQFELEELKENINVILEEDFPEEVESDEERTIKNNLAKNLKETFKKTDSNQKLENKELKEKKLKTISKEKMVYTREVMMSHHLYY